MFILYFIIAAIITTACMSMGISADVFAPLKELSKFFIIMAMAAIGLNTSFAKLCKSGAKPMLHGFIISLLVVLVAIAVEYALGNAPGGVIG